MYGEKHTFVFILRKLCVMSARNRQGKRLTLFQCVILKQGLSCLVHSDIQRNISITVHRRERRASLQKEPKDKNDTLRAKRLHHRP